MPLGVRADLAPTNLTAEAILARVLANRPTKDFSLKARLFVTREQTVPVEILVKNTATETRTIYRTGKQKFLVVQPVRGEPRFYASDVGELTGSRRMERLFGSEFSCYDLGLPFLQWPETKLLGEDRTRGRYCYLLEARATAEPYAHAKLWIDKEYCGLLRVEAFNADHNVVKRLAITSFKRIGELWIPRGMECASLPPGQSLPSEVRSRLEIYEGNYDVKLPDEWFAADQFVAPAP